MYITAYASSTMSTSPNQGWIFLGTPQQNVKKILNYHIILPYNIFLGAIYQNGKNTPNHHKLYQMAITYRYQTTTKNNEWLWNIPKFCIPRPLKKLRNLDFWYENIPSANPAPTYLQ
jgi:hypothetical protein